MSWLKAYNFGEKRAINFESICLGLLFSFFEAQTCQANLCISSLIFSTYFHGRCELGQSTKSWLREWFHPHCSIQISKYTKTEGLQPNGLLRQLQFLAWQQPWLCENYFTAPVCRKTELAFTQFSYGMNNRIPLTTYGHLVTKVQCLWPSSWDYWYCALQFQAYQANKGLKLACLSVYWICGQELLSQKSTSCICEVSASRFRLMFSSVSASAHTSWRSWCSQRSLTLL